MWRGATWTVIALVTGCAMTVAQPDNTNWPMDTLSSVWGFRPPKVLIRAVKRMAPELFMDMEQEVKALGYPLETHKVRTEDGYILTLFRIPHGRDSNFPSDSTSGSSGHDNSFRHPVLLQHGIFGCSEQWILGGPGVSPAYTLADHGYDVWISNIRGNAYSKKHETMGKKDPRFWIFSWHEMGYYDIPAVIDYVLNATKQEKLFYVGHSMGNTMFHVTLSMKPEYNSKVRLFISLAPAIYFDEVVSAPIRVAVANVDYIKAIVNANPTYEIFSKTNSLISLSYLFCSDSAYFSKLCAVLYSWTVGPMDLNNTTKLYQQLGRGMDSTSALVLIHFGQNILSGDFQLRDLGAQNIIKYGTAKPPKYPINKVTVPVIIYASETDFVVPIQGVKRLAKELPNLVSLKIVEEKLFNHNDFLFHPRLTELIFNDALEIMERFKDQSGGDRTQTTNDQISNDATNQTDTESN